MSSDPEPPSERVPVITQTTDPPPPADG